VLWHEGGEKKTYSKGKEKLPDETVPWKGGGKNALNFLFSKDEKDPSKKNDGRQPGFVNESGKESTKKKEKPLEIREKRPGGTHAAEQRSEQWRRDSEIIARKKNVLCHRKKGKNPVLVASTSKIGGGNVPRRFSLGGTTRLQRGGGDVPGLDAWLIPGGARNLLRR